MKRKRKYNKKRIFITVISIIIILIIMVMLLLKIINNNSNLTSHNIFTDNASKVSDHYNKYVKTNKETIIYDENKEEVGKIGKDVELMLEEIEITKDTESFNISDFDKQYYIKYQDVNKIDSLSEIDNRYKNYIVFNENIITIDNTNFYDENDNLVYSFNKSFDLPIIIKEDNKYGVEINNRLLYVLKDEVKEVKKNYNTDKTNASGVGVLNYHAFYDENNEEDKSSCNTEICHSKSQFKSHLDYFKENNIFPLKIEELEMYVDGKIQLPKSVLITIDDGGRTEIAVDMLTEYKMYATIFLVTSWYDPSSYYATEYIELHSHSHHMHETGVCPTGQGGGIQCLSEVEIQEDLKTAREKLNNTTYFCYPFYEYNDYSIKMLKEAGFTMAFIGESNSSDNLVHVDSDKFRLRRFVIVTYTTLNDFDKYFGQIH